MSTAPLRDVITRVRVARTGRARQVSRVATACLLAPAPIMMLRPLFPAHVGEIALATLFAAFPLFVVAFGLRRGVERAATLDVDASGFHFRDGYARAVERADVETAMVVPGRRPTVELALADTTTLRIQVDSVEAGDRMLDAARLSAGARRSAHRLATLRSWIIPAIASSGAPFLAALPLTAVANGIFHFDDASVFALMWTLFTLGAWIVARFLAPPHVVVGADGVSIEGIGSRRRFVSFSDLRHVEVKFGGLRFVLMNGSVAWANGVELDPRAVQAAAHRIDEARRAHALAGVAEATSLLDRRDEAVAAWRARARALLKGDAGYRSVGVSSEDALAVLENPAASAEHRLGAALALGGESGPEVRRRIADVASACASGPLRVALEHAAEGELDDEALVAALYDRA